MKELKTSHWTLTLILCVIFGVGMFVLITSVGCAKQGSRAKVYAPDWEALYVAQMKLTAECRDGADKLAAENLQLYLENSELRTRAERNQGAANLLKKARENYKGDTFWKNGKS